MCITMLTSYIMSVGLYVVMTILTIHAVSVVRVEAVPNGKAAGQQGGTGWNKIRFDLTERMGLCHGRVPAKI